MNMPPADPQLIYLTVDVWHPDCWTLHATKAVDAGLLGYEMTIRNGDFADRFRTVVMGHVVGQHIAAQDIGTPSMPDDMRSYAERAMDSLASFADSDGNVRPSALIADLRQVMDDHAGILRDEETLRDGLETVRDIGDRTADLDLKGDRTDFELAVDLSYMLIVAKGVLRGALQREESRGAHFRTDFPEARDTWRQNLLYARENTGPSLSTRELAQPSLEIRSAIEEGYELEYHHLE
jgi:succinate dehydrogenase / fumarate reductase flavoprotein subunit